ncbi:PD-(D/E)XK nuclease superfamily protein, partial [Vibrio parahaemolyticus V-223/04]
CLHRR